MTASLAPHAADVLLATNQTGGGSSGTNWELILLVGVVGLIVLGLAWLALKSGGSAD